jgi:hypothetical protein
MKPYTADPCASSGRLTPHAEAPQRWAKEVVLVDNATLTTWTGLFTAAAALLAILEMRLQRIAGYKPELIVLAPALCLVPALGFPPWSCFREYVVNEASQKPALYPGVDCINVGAGVARSVVATWEFDRQLAVEQLAPVLAKQGYFIWSSEDEGVSRIELEEGDQARVGIVGDLSAATHTPYLLPLQGPGNLLYIPLPPDFLLLLRLQLLCVSSDSTSAVPLMKLQRLPSLILGLVFTDAGGATRKDTVKLRFHLTSLASTTNSAGSASVNEAKASATVTSTRKRWSWLRL